jgi:hypothetical protein
MTRQLEELFKEGEWRVVQLRSPPLLLRSGLDCRPRVAGGIGVSDTYQGDLDAVDGVESSRSYG